MMKVLLIFISLICFASNMQSQDLSDTIGYSKKKGDLKFFKKNQEIKFLELSKILKSNSEANDYVKKAKTYRNLNGICLGIGIISLSYGVLFGLAQAIENKDESNVYAGLISGTVVGGIFIALSIPSGRSYKVNAKKAIDIYNRDIINSTSRSYNFKTGITQNGVSVILTF